MSQNTAPTTLASNTSDLTLILINHKLKP